jgi:hypothetical protein
MSKKAKLFNFEVNLMQDGKLELLCDCVNPEEFEKTMNNGLPEYDGAHSIATLLRYVKSMSDEIIEKSGKYV